MSINPKFDLHMFICERCRFDTAEGKSDPMLAQELRIQVKEMAKELWEKNEVRVNSSGCLGQCERGISCVVYPMQHWELELRPGDAPHLIEVLKRLKNE